MLHPLFGPECFSKQLLLSIQRQFIHVYMLSIQRIPTLSNEMQCTYIRHLTESDLSDLHQVQVESRACVFYQIYYASALAKAQPACHLFEFAGLVFGLTHHRDLTQLLQEPDES